MGKAAVSIHLFISLSTPLLVSLSPCPLVSLSLLNPEPRTRLGGNPPPRPWLVGPAYDSLLIANVAWPLLLLWQLGDGFSGREGLQFWQIYFVTTPHRWITLALVFLDRERFGQRRFVFLALAAAAITFCLGVRITTGALTCLLTIDYIWNAWHFASQHHGIYRIYSRVARQPVGQTFLSAANFIEPIEKWSFRLFLLYVILRVAGTTWSYLSLEQSLRTIDWLVLAVPAWLLIRDLAQLRFSPGRSIYLLSVTALYISLLAAIHANRPALVLSLTTASALFHATEYLALVAWNVRGRSVAMPDRLGIMNYLAPRWGLALGTFILILGSSGWLLNEHLMQTWLTLNVIIAFLHYAYDGLIWRVPKNPLPLGEGGRAAAG